MRSLLRFVPSLALTVAFPAKAQLLSWSPRSFSGDAVRAQITGGPWTLGTPAAYPASNVGTTSFEPDYQPFVTVDGSGTLQGLFDYRPEELEEAVLEASSSDGIHWTFAGEALGFADAGSDDGQGHPFAMAVGNNLFLYTLDRTTGEIDSAQLLVNALPSTGSNLLAGLPSVQVPVPAPGAPGSIRTTGLLNPDGIIGVVPGSNPVEILYVQKQLAVANGADLTTVRLATTEDGLAFDDLGSMSGLTDPCVANPSTCVTESSVTYVASRGTLFAITDGSGAIQGYGLLFSAGLWGEDSDAYHYVGYAESTDLQTWTVFNGLGSAGALPLISIDGNDLTPTGQFTGMALSWYQARAYAPSAVTDPTGCASLNLIFSGYSGSAKKTTDYRQVGQVTLDLSNSGRCVIVAGLALGTNSASSTDSTSTVSSSGGTTTSGSVGAGSLGSTGGSTATAGSTSSGTGGSTLGGSTSNTTGGSTSGSSSTATSTSGTSGGNSGGASTTLRVEQTTSGGTSAINTTNPASAGSAESCSTGSGTAAWIAVLAAATLCRRAKK